MVVWVVTNHHDIVEICDSPQKAMNMIADDLEIFVNEGHMSQSNANEILRALKEGGDSWLYHIEPWEVY